jgi:hypothetical protein
MLAADRIRKTEMKANNFFILSSKKKENKEIDVKKKVKPRRVRSRAGD